MFTTQSRIFEHHVQTYNVIAETPSAQPQPVLTAAKFLRFELYDVVTSALIVGIRL